jgi:3',5'-cyclic-AMP phosphodiesterase
MLIAQLSDIHIGGARHHGTLLRDAIAEINDATLDVVVIAGDITDEGYPDQHGEPREQLEALACPNVVAVPGNQDSRHVGYLQYERTFGARDSVPIRGTGRERNQVLDAGDVLALLHQAEVDAVLSGHRHVPYVWPVAGMLLIRSGTAATLRTRAFTQPVYNLIRADASRISIQLRVPGGDGRSLGEYPRDWPAELSARSADPLAHASPGQGLANDARAATIRVFGWEREAVPLRHAGYAGPARSVHRCRPGQSGIWRPCASDRRTSAASRSRMSIRASTATARSEASPLRRPGFSMRRCSAARTARASSGGSIPARTPRSSRRNRPTVTGPQPGSESSAACS